MSGFIRRYSYFPDSSVISAIEGVVIVDLPPPGSIQGVDEGTVLIIGEFANMQYAVDVSTSGAVTTDPRPVAILGSQDLVDKTGPFDELIGNFGTALGNGFVEIRSKSFQSLVVCPVDILTSSAVAQQGACRFWRELPTNQSATIAQPIVPVTATLVEAGREFTNVSGDARLASRAIFGDAQAYATGVDGNVTGSSSTFQTFNSVSANFTTLGVVKGDALVLGVIGAASFQGSNANTYRVRSVVDLHNLTYENQDGTAFAAAASSSALAWRLHLGNTADTGPVNAFSEAAGYQVLARPLSATIAAGQALLPLVAPPANSATSWDPQSGLGGETHPTIALTYDAALHLANVGNSATMDARYQAALAACLDDSDPANTVQIVVPARKSSTIRNATKQHVLTASQRDLTRRAILSPEVNQNTFATVIGSADPGVGANRSDRVDYSWPGARVSVPEAVGFKIATADGKTTTDGILDVCGDAWLASIESNLPPERNPGQGAAPVPDVTSPILGLARGTPKLDITFYTALRAAGVAALRLDRSIGAYIIQSGVTTSLNSGEKNINRRRMADYVQDSIARALVQFSKLPLTKSLKDSAVSETVAFLNGLLSPNNPAAQRINGYTVDDVSGNTPALTAQNIFVLVVAVAMTPTADDFVLQTNIGNGVVTAVTLPTA